MTIPQIKVTGPAIVAAVESYFELGSDALRSSSKLPKLALARSLVAWLCRNYTSLSFPAIGRLMNKHHTTVILARRRLLALASESDREAIDAIMGVAAVSVNGPGSASWLNDTRKRFRETNEHRTRSVLC